MTSNLKGKEFEAKLAEILDTFQSGPGDGARDAIGWLQPKDDLDYGSSAAVKAIRSIWSRGPTEKSKEKIQFSDAVVLARRLHKVKMDASIRSAVRCRHS